MDPNANRERQLEIARLIQEAMREPLGTVKGFVNEDSLNEALAGYATELAELVLALDEWIAKGGFLPAAWGAWGEQR